MVELNIYLSIPVPILDRFLDSLSALLELLGLMLPDWEALAMFWPEVLTFIVVGVFLTVGLVCLGELLESLSSRANNYSCHKPKGKVSHSYRTDPNNRRLQHQLIQMLRGDTATAKRLLAQQRQRNPGRSDNWYLEKVIYDLERDRRR
ncbi:hypothetical protein WDZ92_11185 [Nostoc sp. NIES-2111]